MRDFLLACFQKDPQRRPGAAALLRHRWVRHHRATLRASWSRTAGLKARGGRTDAHVCVSAVVERILQVDAADAAAGPNPNGPLPGGIADSATEVGLGRGSGAGGGGVGGGGVAVDVAAGRGGGGASPGAEPDGGGLATPAQRVEPPRPSAKKRPPPLDRAAMEAPVSAFAQAPAGAGAGSADAPISPLSGLLSGLSGGGGGAPPGAGAAGQDLGAWLAEQEAAAPAGAPAGAPGGAGAPGAGSPGGGGGGAGAGAGVVDGAPTRHQEVAEVRRLVAALRQPPLRGEPGGAGDAGRREAALVAACGAAAAALAAAPERRGAFLAEDGGCALLELLAERSAAVAGAALALANAAVAGDARCLEAGAALGLAPAVGRYAAPGWPRPLRAQAAAFLHALVHAGLPTARVLVACQGLPYLAALVDPDLSDGGALTAAGLACVWRLLELHGRGALNSLCRLLAAAGLGPRLVGALGAAAAALGPPAAAGKAAPPPGGEPEPGAGGAGVRLPAARVTSAIAGGLLRRAASGGGKAAPAPPAARAGAGAGGAGAAALAALADRACDLLLVLAHGDAAVKAGLAAPGAAAGLLAAAAGLPAGGQVKALRALRLLSGDPGMLGALQAEGCVAGLVPWLAPAAPGAAQAEALHALYNLCKISRARQEAAAAAGAVPYLAGLAARGAHGGGGAPNGGGGGGGGGALRPLAVGLLCGMAAGSERTRAELWANSGLDILLNLLAEREWAPAALDALAAWLGEDAGRLEPRLAQADAVQRLVAPFGGAAAAGDSEALARLLEPFLRLLRRSPRVTVRAAARPAGR